MKPTRCYEVISEDSEGRIMHQETVFSMVRAMEVVKAERQYPSATLVYIYKFNTNHKKKHINYHRISAKRWSKEEY